MNHDQDALAPRSGLPLLRFASSSSSTYHAPEWSEWEHKHGTHETKRATHSDRKMGASRPKLPSRR